MSDYYDYDSDAEEFARPENRLRERFRSFERERFYGVEDDSEDRPPSNGQRNQGCQRYSTYGCLIGVLLVALFRGGIFNGEISLPRRGCQWILTGSIVGFALIAGSVFVSYSGGNASTVAGLGLCGGLICLSSGGGFIAALIMGTRFLAFSGLLPGGEEGGGFDFLERLRGEDR